MSKEYWLLIGILFGGFFVLLLGSIEVPNTIKDYQAYQKPSAFMQYIDNLKKNGGK